MKSGLWVAALAVALAAPPARAGEVVRIAVALGQTRVVITGRGLASTALREGAPAAPLPRGRAELSLRGDELIVDGQAVDAGGLTFSGDEALRVDAMPGAALAGELEVRRLPGGLAVIHALPLEDYVAAVAGAEMPASFPPEALRAQAVAARTFAVFKKLEAVVEGRPYHLGATVLHQVYRAGPPDPRARAATLATAGEVLVFQHVAIEAYFHSTCGGHTERGADALGRDLPYLASVACDFCRASPRRRWTVRVAAGELGERAALGAPVTGARVVLRTASGRAARVELSGRGRSVTLSAVDLRQRLGFGRLPSLDFELRAERGAVRFDGRGAGHGAGLCQWGAAGAAAAGEGYRQILARYYPGAEIVRMY
ncbi:MAG TPA: SpoIID/LytB domain-containing protein [Anaeromyxobacteraceae bacterium]|nr:SpoIID/LytB domain-containing protein [Anaeromyxobacteraceae bacterium]